MSGEDDGETHPPPSGTRSASAPDGESALGRDAAASALSRAREAARAKGLRPGAPGRTAARRRGSTSARSAQPDSDHGVPGTGPGFPPGAGPDPRSMADSLSRVIASQGWSAPISANAVIGRWPQVVGDQVAQHTTPETFTDGKLVVRTSSTAWATQLRMLLPQLERKIAAEIGEGVVTEIVVLGPGAPSWVKGPRVVRGRGPRDTYG